ncbi:mechanosensitive ion channel family protein [Gulosibacter molinativorax]|uniref:Mechanosensitive ion channel protein MscS n=1 Tax=Gulosibacter molinativorax TaxID=256821 RepID=A0ABT7C9G3_9MICO|nr:mechanosensitive ion channel domain-containing protein [Gulosibacter molinativorax]MDJ1371794.1 mechanosensitive ion channel protein MscS [Gulosibacter molinativorax]QUY60834.1 Putative MscS family protein YkuT [Gulosibacter molinativorax]
MQAFFDSVADFLGPFLPFVEAALVLIGAWLLTKLLSWVIRRSADQIVQGVKKKRGVDDTQMLALKSPLASVRTVQRTRTIGQVLTVILKATIWIVATLWAIGIINANFLASLTVLSAAVGAGLGFGAQKIVGDVLNGLLMVVEDQIGVGDDVDMEHASGVVESVGVRVTQIRDVYGQLWFVRNGEIQRVGNNSQGWNRAIIDLAIPFDADRAKVQQTILEAAKELTEDPDWMLKLLEEPTIWGLQTLSAEAVIVRLVVKTTPGDRWGVERELRARIQDALKREEIDLPAMNTIVFDGPNGIQPRRATGIDDKQDQQRRTDAGEAPTA